VPTSSPVVRLLALIAVLLPAIAAGGAARADIGSSIVVDAATGQVLAADNPFQPWYPASITKLMTTYVTFRAMRAGRLGPNSPVTISQNAASRPPSKMGFKVGTVLTIDAALKIIMVKSANDIAVAIGESVGGSEAAFVAEMNAEARRLGMTTTRFYNPHGLPHDGQVTSARDMAILARALLTEFPEHRDLFSITSLKLGKQTIRTHNKLLERFKGADGMKTGFICNSGFNMVATATRNGRTLIAVVLGAYTTHERNEAAARMFTEAFAQGGGSLFGGGRQTLATLRVPADVGQPESRRKFVCGPNRARAQKEAAAEGESGDDDGDAQPAKRRSYLEARFNPREPVTIALGGADPVPPAPSPYAAVAAAEAAPAGVPMEIASTGAPLEIAATGPAVPMPMPRPTRALAGGPGIEPVALVSEPGSAVETLLHPGAGPAATALAVPEDIAPPRPTGSIASAAQPGLQVPISIIPHADAATMPPIDLTQPFLRGGSTQ